LLKNQDGKGKSEKRDKKGTRIDHMTEKGAKTLRSAAAFHCKAE